MSLQPFLVVLKLFLIVRNGYTLFGDEAEFELVKMFFTELVLPRVALAADGLAAEL